MRRRLLHDGKSTPGEQAFRLRTCFFLTLLVHVGKNEPDKYQAARNSEKPREKVFHKILPRSL
jgi:hypothetical protein